MTHDQIAELINSSPMNRGMDGARWLSDPANIAIVRNGNVMLFGREGETVFQFHWLHTATKGRQAIRDTREAMREVFRDTNAQAIYGLVYVGRRDSALMARWIGATYCGDTATAHGRCQIFLITRENLKGSE